MKILHVISSMNPVSGGPCQVLRNTIPELELLGSENTIVCLDDPDSFFIKNDPLHVVAVGSGKGPWSYNAALSQWLLPNLLNYDIVICHGLWLYTTYSVKITLQRYQKMFNDGNLEDKKIPKLYIMPHGMLDPYFQKAPDRRLKAVRNWLYWKVIEGKVVNNAQGLLFTCLTEQQLARETFTPYRPNSEMIVGLGVHDAPVFTKSMQDEFEKKCPQVKGRSFILFLSRIHKKKGVDLLLKAYENLLRAGKTLPHLVIAGPGIDTDYGADILNMVNLSSVLRNHVVFPGMLSGDAKWGAFYASEAFILPSHQENFGIAVVEAMSCAKAVLISDQVNIWHEIVSEGGGMVNIDNLDGTTKLLQRWTAQSKIEKEEMGKRAKEAFLKVFYIKPASKRLYDVLMTEQSRPDPVLFH